MRDQPLSSSVTLIKYEYAMSVLSTSMLLSKLLRLARSLETLETMTSLERGVQGWIGKSPAEPIMVRRWEFVPAYRADLFTAKY